MSCKLKNAYSNVVSFQPPKEIEETTTPVKCPKCGKVWKHVWDQTCITTTIATAFCSPECKNNPPEDLECGHLFCHQAGPAVRRMVPNPYHPDYQRKLVFND